MVLPWQDDSMVYWLHIYLCLSQDNSVALSLASYYAMLPLRSNQDNKLTISLKQLRSCTLNIVVRGGAVSAAAITQCFLYLFVPVTRVHLSAIGT